MRIKNRFEHQLFLIIWPILVWFRREREFYERYSYLREDSLF